MKPLNIVYWSRVGFGVVAALVCVLLIDVKVGNPLISGMSVGILVYIITYYVLKWRFMAKVEKPSKVLTMGIGAYFLTWIVCWGLFVTLLLQPPIATFTFLPQNPIVEEPVLFDATASDDPDGRIVKYAWNFGDEITGEGKTINHTYASPGNYTVTLTVKDDEGLIHKTETILTVSLNVTSS